MFQSLAIGINASMRFPAFNPNTHLNSGSIRSFRAVFLYRRVCISPGNAMYSAVFEPETEASYQWRAPTYHLLVPMRPKPSKMSTAPCLICLLMSHPAAIKLLELDPKVRVGRSPE